MRFLSFLLYGMHCVHVCVLNNGHESLISNTYAADFTGTTQREVVLLHGLQ